MAICHGYALAKGLVALSEHEVKVLTGKISLPALHRREFLAGERVFDGAVTVMYHAFKIYVPGSRSQRSHRILGAVARSLRIRGDKYGNGTGFFIDFRAFQTCLNEGGIGIAPVPDGEIIHVDARKIRALRVGDHYLRQFLPVETDVRKCLNALDGVKTRIRYGIFLTAAYSPPAHAFGIDLEGVLIKRQQESRLAFFDRIAHVILIARREFVGIKIHVGVGPVQIIPGGHLHAAVVALPPLPELVILVKRDPEVIMDPLIAPANSLIVRYQLFDGLQGIRGICHTIALAVQHPERDAVPCDVPDLVFLPVILRRGYRQGGVILDGRIPTLSYTTIVADKAVDELRSLLNGTAAHTGPVGIALNDDVRDVIATLHQSYGISKLASRLRIIRGIDVESRSDHVVVPISVHGKRGPCSHAVVEGHVGPPV